MDASWLQFFITIYGYGKQSSDIRKIKGEITKNGNRNVKMLKQLRRKLEIYSSKPLIDHEQLSFKTTLSFEFPKICLFPRSLTLFLLLFHASTPHLTCGNFLFNQ